MQYAVYIRDSMGNEEVSVMNDIELQHIAMDILMDEAEIEEDLLVDLDFDEIMNLLNDTLQEGIDYNDTDRMIVVNERDKTIIDVDRRY
jgi:hypothetical protein